MGLKSKLFMAVATSAAGAAMIAGGTFAYFTSSATNSGNTFSTGTVQVQLSTDNTNYLDNIQSINVQNAAPGDPATVKDFYVKNTGSLPEYVTVLPENLVLSNGTVSYTIFDKSGTFNAQSWTAAQATFTNLGQPSALQFTINDLTTNKVLFDSANPSTSTLESAYLLAPGATDEIEMTISLASTADNSYQGSTFNGDLAFNAEQSANITPPTNIRS